MQEFSYYQLPLPKWLSSIQMPPPQASLYINVIIRLRGIVVRINALVQQFRPRLISTASPRDLFSIIVSISNLILPATLPSCRSRFCLEAFTGSWLLIFSLIPPLPKSPRILIMRNHVTIDDASSGSGRNQSSLPHRAVSSGFDKAKHRAVANTRQSLANSPRQRECCGKPTPAAANAHNWSR
jgi:hypothetical protein